jgi:hypothetical protein
MLKRIMQELQTYLGTKAFISLVTGILVNVLLVFFDIDFAIKSLQASLPASQICASGIRSPVAKRSSR